MLNTVIRNWNVRNFKSVGEAHLLLAPLTVFAGANSSGKSTLIQSILLIAQTLAARGTTQTVVLNGHIIKLGQFDDLRNDASRENAIELSWTLTPALVEDRTMMRLRRMQNRIDSVECEVLFGLSDEAEQVEQLNPILRRFSLSCALRRSAQDGAEGELEQAPSFIRLTRRSAPKPEEELTAPQRARTRINFDLAVQLDDESLEDLRDDYPEAHTVGCILQSFLPSSLVVKFDERRELVRAMVGILTGTGRARFTRNLVNSKAMIPVSLLNELKQRISASGEMFPEESVAEGHLISAPEFVDRLRAARGRSPLTAEIIKEIGAYALSKLPFTREITSVALPGDVLGDAVEITRDFFARQIKYLGPLREEPKALYPLQNTADPQEVGLHGEHTAAVLHRFRISDVEYVPTRYFARDEGQPMVQSASLEEAVFEWLRYLDVASDVNTIDEGKFGYGLKVRIEGSESSHDLTHVGVGVSQVLPIVVMCLLANRDTTIVLEQPELHLNPKVQTRLADFFLSMALMQKQCIIETHSEYLINRLRLRSARAPGKSVSELIKLYFVEKVGGFTTYRDVVINEFGTIMRWPKGFFDQSQKEIEEILLAADRKTT